MIELIPMFGFIGTTAAIVAGVVGAGAMAGASVAARNAQKKAEATNRLQQERLNDKNYQFFLESRGSDGYAVLPYYANENGDPMEPILFQDALDTYNVFKETSPQDRMASYQELVDMFTPAAQGGRNYVDDIYSGQLERKQIADAEPVFGARTDIAKARSLARRDALDKTLNQIKAIAQKRGFSGDSYGKRLLEYNATADINADSAVDLAGAKLENEKQRLGFKQASDNLRQANLFTPYQLGEAAVNMKALPETFTAGQTQKMQGLFQPFNIGTSRYSDQPLPPVQPRMSNFGIAAEAIGGISKNIGTIGALNAMAGAYGQGMGSAMAAAPASAGSNYMSSAPIYTGYGMSY